MFRKNLKPAEPLEDIAARAIREAKERGEWNLSGQGKPLKLHGDLSDTATMAGHIRGNAGFGTPWGDLGREIDADLRRIRDELRQARRRRDTALRAASAEAPAVEATWSRALQELEKQIAAANSKILKFNLLIPFQLPHLHRARLRLEALLEEVEA